ncbi:MAG: hypothetical protein SFV52_04930 [Saprospiraceae bacterium]|nr:hypothetical protein [Saprospiraceae bacterium]
MKPISADTIDRVIDELDNLSEDQYEQRMTAFAEAQPMLLAWLETESFDFLSEDEKGYLEYLALIIWSAVEKGGESPEPAEEEAIGEAEEANYDIMEQTAGKPFRERLDPFFEGYAQEDLLSFAEEAVLEDEEDPESLVTKEGREVIFVSLKTVIDVLT